MSEDNTLLGVGGLALLGALAGGLGARQLGVLRANPALAAQKAVDEALKGVPRAKLNATERAAHVARLAKLLDPKTQKVLRKELGAEIPGKLKATSRLDSLTPDQLAALATFAKKSGARPGIKGTLTGAALGATLAPLAMSPETAALEEEETSPSAQRETINLLAGLPRVPR